MSDQAQNLRELVEQKKKEKIEEIYEDKNIDIYAVTSGKGGVGKTNVTVNLAISLQRLGKKVLIIDADLGTANVDIVIGTFPKVTLFDVFFNDKSLEDAIIEGPEGVKIIPGGSGIMKMTDLDSGQQSKLADEFLLLEGIDTILIDTGAGISMNLMSFITFANEIIIVTTPEPTAITDAYGVIKVVADLKFKKEIKVIVNKVSKPNLAKNTFDRLNETVSKFLGLELSLMGYVLDDSRVQSAVMERTPFILLYPNSLASKCIESIAQTICNKENKDVKIRTMSEVYNRLLKVFG